MKRPWQIWLLYLFCMAIVLPAMLWLTWKTLELDRAEAAARLEAERARQQAELQELAGSALWRLDWTLTPLVAQEAARPYFVYQPFYEVGAAAGGKARTIKYEPSPLLIQPSDYVLLHFQVDERDQWTSPQNPTGEFCVTAVQCGVSETNMKTSAARLAELKREITQTELVSSLPDQLLPQVNIQPAAPQLSVNNLVGPLQSQTDVVQDLGLSQIPSQIAFPQSIQQNETFNLPPAQQSAAPQRQQGQARSRRTRQAEQAAQVAEQQQRSKLLREGYEWQHRNAAYQSYASNQMRQQRFNMDKPATQLVREGVSRPIWVGAKLLLARRVVHDNQIVIQGCWLNWDKIRHVLLAEIEDLMPDADLTPVYEDSEVQAGRLLATLPVQLVVSPTRSGELPVDGGWSAIQISIWIAWAGLLLAATAVAIMLHGVIKLSERRAAFVSAVTHELRTPLTTFRMYAEMLSQGMVQGADQRQQYLETLRVESDRLTHLVENVLQYARLERGGSRRRRRQQLTLSEMADRVAHRIEDRAEQAGMQLKFETSDEDGGVTLQTDPAAVEQILFNLVDNACKYACNGNDRRIHLRFHVRPRWVAIEVRDHGKGISADEARRLFRPFSKSVDEAACSAPGVGLGLALCRRLATDLGGRLDLSSSGEPGASFVLKLPI